MLEDTAIHRRTAMVVIRHGDKAADFAAMVARELAKAGDADGSKTWWSVSRAAKELLTGFTMAPTSAVTPPQPKPV